MNKQAAEKIATEYYNLGIQLALQQAGLIKSAQPTTPSKPQTTWQQRASGGKIKGKTPAQKAEEADTFNWLKDMQAQGA